MIGIRQQGVWEGVPLPEPLLGADGVGADAEHHDVLTLKSEVVVAKTAGLLDASRGICSRVKEKDYPLAQEVSQADASPLIGLEFEIWSRISGLWPHRAGTSSLRVRLPIIPLKGVVWTRPARYAMIAASNGLRGCSQFILS
jgi:hypothetical protein